MSLGFEKIIARLIQHIRRFVSKTDEKGFTLIEIGISISISIILAAVVIPQYRELQKRLFLLKDAYRLSESVREAQEMALSGKEVEGDVHPGYGVFVTTRDPEDRRRYVIYADRNDNDRYQSGTDLVVSTVELSEDVEIADLSGAAPPPVDMPLHINFSSPEPRTKLRMGADQEWAEIELMVVDTSYRKTVYVNKAGLSYVK